jgi:SAM-dependent methyltransferase
MNSPSTSIHGLKRFKHNIGAAVSKYFWLRYVPLAIQMAMRAGIASITGRTTSGSTHAASTVRDAVSYVSRVFEDYKVIAGVNQFHGKIAEIGTGDSCGVGLMFLADGCDHVDLTDRFFAPRDNAHQQEISRNIASRFPQLVTAVHDDRLSESSFKGLERHYGKGAAAEIFFQTHAGYDAIVSRAVFEHLYDPLLALSVAAQALKPGGIMVHRIDCRDHELFSLHFHELKFLELPAILYSPFKWCGCPNRLRLNDYVGALRQEPVEFEIYITRLAGVTDELPIRTKFEEIDANALSTSRAYVAGVRKHMARPFRDLAEEALMVQGFVISARKL